MFAASLASRITLAAAKGKIVPSSFVVTRAMAGTAQSETSAVRFIISLSHHVCIGWTFVSDPNFIVQFNRNFRKHAQITIKCTILTVFHYVFLHSNLCFFSPAILARYIFSISGNVMMIVNFWNYITRFDYS